VSDTTAAEFRTPEQIARRTGLSRKAIYRAIERGELAAYRLCGRLRIATTDEQTWIDQNRVSPAVSAKPNCDLRPRPAAGQHSLRRLLPAREKSTGLVGARSYDATPDNDKQRPGDA
jgi:excisionase family DNA binding protein